MPKPLRYPVAAALLCAAAVFAATLDDVPFTTPVLDGPDYLGLQYLMTLPTYSAVSNFVDALGYAGAISNEALLRLAGDAANSNNIAAVRTELLATNAAARAALELHAAGHAVTANGGFAGGTGATAATGGAAGMYTVATSGGAVGEWAGATSGGAVGEGASALSGGAVGFMANVETGGAVGASTQTTTGGAVGEGAAAGAGFAGGYGARAEDGNMLIDAIQLGTGVNAEAGTLQVYLYKLLNADGKIPVERMPMPTNIVSGWLMYDPGSNMWLRVSVSNWSFTVGRVLE